MNQHVRRVIPQAREFDLFGYIAKDKQPASDRFVPTLHRGRRALDVSLRWAGDDDALLDGFLPLVQGPAIGLQLCRCVSNQPNEWLTFIWLEGILDLPGQLHLGQAQKIDQCAVGGHDSPIGV